MYRTHHHPALRRCLVAAVAALAGSGLIGAAAQDALTPAAGPVAAAAPAHVSAAVAAAPPAAPAAPRTATAPHPARALPATPSSPATLCTTSICCPPPPPQAQTMTSLEDILAPCGTPLLQDPVLHTFMVNDCAHAQYVTVGTFCAVSSDPDGVAILAGTSGNADAGELAVSAGGTAYACGGPAPIAVSAGPSSSCQGRLPTSAREGGVSFNGG